MTAITTLFDFAFAGGASPTGPLLEDAAGDLFGTAFNPFSSATTIVYEIAKTSDGYASSPTVVGSFSNSSDPTGGLAVDAAGDLFVQSYDFASDSSNIYEIAKSGSGYGAPKVLANVAGRASSNLTFDPYGDLIGSTFSNTTGLSLFELRPIGTSFSSTPVSLGVIPGVPVGSTSYSPISAVLATDSADDLFVGVNASHFAFRILFAAVGVFEIAGANQAHAGAPQLLTSFATGLSGLVSLSSLIVGASGDLFGDLANASPDGSVFEIAKTASGYASAPNFLPSPERGNSGNLVQDADGNLFTATDDAVAAFIRAPNGTYIRDNLVGLANSGGSVILGLDGSLYGVTGRGGANDLGTFFKITLPALSIIGVSVASATGLLTVAGVVDLPDRAHPVSLYEGDELLGTGAPGASGEWSVTSAQAIAAGETDLRIGSANASGGAVSTNLTVFYNTNNVWGVTDGASGPVYLVNAQASITAGGAFVYFEGGADAVSLYNTAGNWDTTKGDGGVVTLVGAQASIIGGGEQIYFAGAAPSAVSLYATNNNWDKATGDGGNLTLVSAQVSVFGGADTIYFDGSAANFVSIYNTNGAWDTAYGDRGSVTLSGAQVSVVGGGDFIYFANGAGNAASLYKTQDDADTVVGSNGYVTLNNAQATINGGLNTIYFNGDDDVATLQSTSGQWDTVFATNGIVNLNGAQASVFGGNAHVDFIGGADNAASLYGSGGNWDTVTGDDGAVTLNGAQASVVGGGDYIYFAAGAGNAVSIYLTLGVQDHVVGSNGAINLTAAETSVTGDNNYLYISRTSVASLQGVNEVIAFQAAIGMAAINGFDVSDVIQFSSADFASWQALSGHIAQAGDDVVISYNANNSVTLKGFSASGLTSANFQFV